MLRSDFCPVSFSFRWESWDSKLLLIVEWLSLKVCHRGHLITERSVTFLRLKVEFDYQVTERQ